MKLLEIPVGEKMELAFTYGGKECRMEVELFNKVGRGVLIPAILDCGVAIHPNKLQNALLIYKTERGYFQFREMDMDLKLINSNYVYLVYSDQESERINRREAYRLFIGKETSIKTTDAKGVERNLRAVIKDLSILGMGILTTYEMSIGDEVETVYKANDKLQLLLRGEVVRVEEIENRKGKIYGIRFDSRTETLSNFITRSQIEKKSGRLDVGEY